MSSDEQAIAKEMIQLCFDDPDPDALTCLVETIGMLTPERIGCIPRVVLFTEDGCSVCPEDEDKYKKLIEDGSIVQIDANSDEGSAIMDKNGLEEIPSLVLLDCNDKLLGEIFDSTLVDGQKGPIEEAYPETPPEKSLTTG